MRIDSIVNIELYENFGDNYPLDKLAREHHGLIYLIGESERIKIGERWYTLSGDEVAFLPKGLRYRVELLENHIKCYVINFEGEVDFDHFILRDCRELLPLFESAAKLWHQHREDLYYRLDCLSITYKLFAELLRRRETASMPLRKKEHIAPVIAYIHEHYSSPELRVNELAPLVGVSTRALCRSFTEVTGYSPKRYLENLRLRRAKELLRSDFDFPIAEVARLVGFREVYHFSSFFKRETGLSPSDFRRAEIRDRFTD